MSENTIVLTQDASEKIQVSLSRESLKYELKQYFRWRKGDYVSRFQKLGTTDHDRFIRHLYSKGYSN